MNRTYNMWPTILKKTLRKEDVVNIMEKHQEKREEKRKIGFVI